MLDFNTNTFIDYLAVIINMLNATFYRLKTNYCNICITITAYFNIYRQFYVKLYRELLKKKHVCRNSNVEVGDI